MLPGLLFAVTGGLSYGLNIVLISKYGDAVPALYYTWFTCFIGPILAAPFAVVLDSGGMQQLSHNIPSIAMYAGVMTLSMLCWMYGCAHETPVMCSVLTTTSSLFACVLGYFWLHEQLTPWVYAGAGLMMLAGVCAAYQKKQDLAAASRSSLVSGHNSSLCQ